MNAKTLIRVVALIVLASGIGCAPAYHRYSGCNADCQYCAPPPLPYTHYDGCACHACAAEPYLRAGRAAAEDAESPALPSDLGERSGGK